MGSLSALCQHIFYMHILTRAILCRKIDYFRAGIKFFVDFFIATHQHIKCGIKNALQGVVVCVLWSFVGLDVSGAMPLWVYNVADALELKRVFGIIYSKDNNLFINWLTYIGVPKCYEYPCILIFRIVLGLSLR